MINLSIARLSALIRSNSRRCFAVAVVTLALFTVLALNLRGAFSSKDAAQAKLDLPALEGEKAIAHLKQQGLYDSLTEAMQAASYSINPVEQPERLGLEPGAHYANSPAQQYRAWFTTDEVRIVPRGESREWQTGMRLVGYGYGDRLTAVGKAERRATASRIEYHREVAGRHEDGSGAKFVEWYENRPEGLEQGFTIAAAPANHQDKRVGERLVVALELTGDWQAKASASGRAVMLAKPDGATVMSYDKLWAKDAAGRELEAGMRVEGGRVLIEVDDTGAQYPLTIDPTFSQQQKLTADDAAFEDAFGRAVAVDGETAVIAAPFEEEDTGGGKARTGAVYVFVRTGSTWTQQQKIAPDGLANGANFGSSVGISGETLVVGAEDDDSAALRTGAVYVFVRDGSVWTQQQKIVASDAATLDRFGHSIAIDGETFVVGAPQDDHAAGADAGAAYVFVRRCITCATLPCPQNISQGTDAEKCGAVVNYTIPAANGECGAVTCAPPSGSLFTVGATTVTCTSASAWACSFTVTVTDTDAPQINGDQLKAQSANAAANCQASIPDVREIVRAQSSDNCTASALLTISQSPVAGSSVSGKGLYPISVTVKDANNNSQTCVVDFIVNDATAPQIITSANLTTNTEPNQCSASVTYTASASDNCDGALTPACTLHQARFSRKGRRRSLARQAIRQAIWQASPSPSP